MEAPDIKGITQFHFCQVPQPSEFEHSQHVTGRLSRPGNVAIDLYLDVVAGRPLRRNWLFAPEMQRILRRPAMRTLLEQAPSMPLLTVDELRSLPMPITVVWGRQEQLLPEAHLDFWRQGRQVSILRPDRAAHSPSVDRPRWFQRMLRAELGLRAAGPSGRPRRVGGR